MPRKYNLLLGSLFFALFALHNALAEQMQILSSDTPERRTEAEIPMLVTTSNKWATKLELQLFTQDELNSSLDSNVENNVLVESEKERPNLRQAPTNMVKVINGSNVRLACAIQSSDTHRLHGYLQEWYRGLHTSFDTANNNSRIELKASGDIRNPNVLEIRNVAEKDNGWYTCVVQLNTTSYMFASTLLDVSGSVYVDKTFPPFLTYNIIIYTFVFALSSLLIMLMQVEKMIQRYNRRNINSRPVNSPTLPRGVSPTRERPLYN